MPNVDRLPPELRRKFVDREQEITNFVNMLEGRDSRCVLLLQGDSGMGKTWLTNVLRHECSLSGVPSSLVRFTSDNPDNFLNVCRHIREHFGAEAFQPFTDKLNWCTASQYDLAFQWMFRDSGKRGAQVFLSYAREDREAVENLYQKLLGEGFIPWMDTENILPGEKWESSIKVAIQRSDFFLACLSADSVNKRGFLQTEISDALDVWREKLDTDIYLIPVRLEDCTVPDRLRRFHWVDLFEEKGWRQLTQAVQVGMERRKEAMPQKGPEHVQSIAGTLSFDRGDWLIILEHGGIPSDVVHHVVHDRFNDILRPFLSRSSVRAGLTAQLIADASHLSAAREGPLVCFFDDIDKADPETATWLWYDFLPHLVGQQGGIKRNRLIAVLSIAQDPPIASEWDKYVRKLRIENLSQEDVKAFARDNGVHDPRMVFTLWLKSDKGCPVRLGPALTFVQEVEGLTMSDDIERRTVGLQEQRQIHIDNLRYLRSVEAKFGIEVPLGVRNSFLDEEREIERLNRALGIQES